MIESKPRCIFKRRKGSFSLRNQPVYNEQGHTVIKSTRVYGIGIDKKAGIKRGHLRQNGVTLRVWQFGFDGWRLETLQEFKERFWKFNPNFKSILKDDVVDSMYEKFFQH